MTLKQLRKLVCEHQGSIFARAQKFPHGYVWLKIDQDYLNDYLKRVDSTPWNIHVDGNDLYLMS